MNTINLNEFTSRPYPKTLITWLSTVVAKRLKKEKKVDYSDLEHIIDYFLATQDPNKNLMGFSYKDAKKKAKVWVEEMNAKAAKITETEQDTERVFTVNDKLHWVKLLTKAAYEREGYLMGHCIGSYSPEESDNYSLRDIYGKSHATLEVTKEGDYIKQVQGKSNKGIHPKYIDAVLSFHKHLGIPINDNYLPKLGYAQFTEKAGEIIEKVNPTRKFIIRDNKKFYYIWG